MPPLHMEDHMKFVTRIVLFIIVVGGLDPDGTSVHAQQ